MKTVTTHQAKTHLSRLMREVQEGETFVILNGSVPMAKLIAAESTEAMRPPVGTVTSAQVVCKDDAFRPLTDEELKVWGL